MSELPLRGEWTDESIGRFWNWYSTNPYLQGEYFSRQVGAGVVNLLKRVALLQGRILDYGCGPGYLMQHLLAQAAADCHGVDFSARSVETVNRTFASNPRWKGAQYIEKLPIPFEAARFDAVTCVETIEHLPDKFLFPLLAELRRVVKPSGVVMFTTPNTEDLEKGMIYCPFCQTQFHFVQHLRSFTPQTLQTMLQEAGFTVELCAGLNFAEFMPSNVPWKNISPSLLYFRARRFLALLPYAGARSPRRFIQSVLRRPYLSRPHLCAVARPSGS